MTTRSREGPARCIGREMRRGIRVGNMCGVCGWLAKDFLFAHEATRKDETMTLRFK